MLYRANIRRWLPYVLPLAIAVGLHAWTMSVWPANFDGDEGITSLMAKHMLEGTDFPIYFYGVNYGGSLPSILAVPFLAIFGVNAIAIRLSVLAGMLAFYVLHIVFCERVFGKNATLLSLLFLILPGFSFHAFIARFSCRWHVYLVLWMGVLLLYQHFPKSPARQWRTLLLMGLFIGLSLWTQPLSLMYPTALGTLVLLSSEEWGRLRHALGKKIRIDIVCTALFCTFALTAPLLLWTGNARWIVLTGALFAGACFAVSTRKKALSYGTAALVLGIALGTLPMWIGWTMFGMVPSPAFYPQMPNWYIVQEILKYVPEAFLGVRSWPILVEQGAVKQMVLGGIIACIAIVAIIHCCHRYRQEIARVLRMERLEKNDVYPLLFLMLFAMSWLAILALPAAGEGIVRYLAPAWQAFAIMTGLLFATLWKKWRIACIAVLAVWLVHFGYFNLRYTHAAWNFERFPVAETEELARYLERKNVTHGYAEFWYAFVLDFVTQERLRLTPYSGNAYYKPYNDELDAASTHAYVLGPAYVRIPKNVTSTQALADEIELRFSWSVILPRLRTQTVVSREQIGQWDVWIVKD